jgi:ribose-phosphate pyrophosphokinase
MSMHRGVHVGLVDARVERFNDAEIFVEVFENVRGEDMFIIQPTSNPANDNLMELLIMTDALRRSSAARITAVIPYFGYARQDRRTKARTPITAKMVANMIVGAGIERVLTLDLHAAQIQGFFDIPVDNLYASPIFALDIRHVSRAAGRITVVSPDVGGVARARELATADRHGARHRRQAAEKPGEVAEMTVIGDVKDKICIIVDDICDTAGTLCKAADNCWRTAGEAAARVVSTRRRRVVIVGMAVMSPSAPGICTSDRRDRGQRRSGETRSNCIVSAMMPPYAASAARRCGLGDHLVDVADHVEGGLGQVVVFAGDHRLEADAIVFSIGTCTPGKPVKTWPRRRAG